MEHSYLIAATTGLLGGFGHCLGMCGPIVAAFAFSKGENKGLWEGVLPQLLYHGGRITTYAVVGGALGAAGSFLNLAGRLSGIRNLVALIAGLFVIAMGIGIVTGASGLNRRIEAGNGRILKWAAVTAKGRGTGRFLLLGLLFGLLPCGLSYSIFMASAATGGIVSGALLAAAFGAGTLPALLSFGLLIDRAGVRLRGWAYRGGGILVIVMGLLFLRRGLHVFL